jgi:hypothetical protein
MKRGMDEHNNSAKQIEMQCGNYFTGRAYAEIQRSITAVTTKLMKKLTSEAT